ncbi:MAG: Asp-tRNA(Asn)/Glu-tRNA(Gln) amidotransferase subunit GatC [Micrococcaceae bacterium]
MPKITREEVAHIASLARIEMTQKELDLMAQEIPSILESVTQISSVVQGDVKPTSHPLPMENVFREDVKKPCLTQEEALQNAPAQEDGCFKVPAILDGE